ncbi:hypothetical protein J1614_005699 [Plenodomus biglobosus]|nr:hypothetical protein J1614_005699 [Plenodomus biglobosus]
MGDEGAKSTGKNDTISDGDFGIPELNALFTRPVPWVLEMVSPPLSHHPSGAGKTSLLYLIIAQAILPASILSSIALECQGAAITLFDPLNHFSVPRLASVMLNLLKTRLSAAGVVIDASTKTELKQTLARSLLHVHIFRPQSWSSLLATLHSLPEYLFDHSRHKSMHRRIHAIILEDIDSFISSLRNSDPEASAPLQSNPLSTASTQLTAQLQGLSSRFSCHTILTSRSVSPSLFRPALPTSWSHSTSVTRLALRRVEVVKFAPAIRVEEAETERQQRWEIVSKGRFECWKVGAGLKGEDGFVFRVGAGVEIEQMKL